MKPRIKVAFASGTDELNRRLVDEMAGLFPELPLYVVSEFPPERGTWVPYRVNRSLWRNLARARAALAGRRIRLSGVMLVPGVPYRRMRLMALLMAPVGLLVFNENLNHFMLHPRHVFTMARHCSWRLLNALRWLRQRFPRPHQWAINYWYYAARLAGLLRTARTRVEEPPENFRPPEGVSVVIPSRNGRELLAAQLPGIERELRGLESEIVVVDNGSDDGTAAWLAREYPQIRVECEPRPLSFARAVNRGIRCARYSRVMLLNNDMELDAGFFAPLLEAFASVPDLFAATAQIRFPQGVRREETGKAVMASRAPTDFPVRCEEPIPGEDQSYVLYGSGGCSLYDAAKLRALGGVDEIYEPAYVEDLDLGVRAWQHGWPTVFVSAAVVEHRHRATTARFYTDAQLAAILELNYVRFLVRAVGDAAVFRKLWREALVRLFLQRNIEALRVAARTVIETGRRSAGAPLWLALGSGGVAVFPGCAASGKPCVLVASPYLPYPLSHGGAVRMYNLMHRAAGQFDLVLVSFCERLETPPREVLKMCVEVVLVRRTGSHAPADTGRPEVVEDFHSAAFAAALAQTVRKWRPRVAQLEFTQMAQYAGDCAPARTILVEHDVTFDLYEQLLRLDGDWELRDQAARWRRFETAAWSEVDRVVVMSEKDRRTVTTHNAVVLANGVDLERFRPAAGEPEPRRLLFIGSFAHLPNLKALDFFLREVWPRLEGATLHVIAGARHDYHRARAGIRIEAPGVEVEGFVADVRPAYRRAAVVIAPLLASAGTNIKIMEAMAMGKAIVSTPAGINGLDLEPGADLLVAETAAEMAAAITGLFENPERRRAIETAARRRAERDFDWDVIARRQARLYHEL